MPEVWVVDEKKYLIGKKHEERVHVRIPLDLISTNCD